MKKFTLLVLSACFMLLYSYSQTYELSFTAVDSEEYVQLDSIKIMNRTRDCDTTLFWPDTVLVLYFVSIEEGLDNNSTFNLYQNYPNPVFDQTTISICIPGKDKVKLTVIDALGRQVIGYEKVLDKGCHDFSLNPGNAEIYFLTATWKNSSQSIKILNAGRKTHQQCSLNYIGSNDNPHQLKSIQALQDFYFITGDELLYIGYYDTLQSGMMDKPEDSKDYTFQFAINMPCPGVPTVTYEGQIYNTIQILSQCWLKENLNVGIMIQGIDDMSDNDTIEKYCYNNEPDSCTKYGGLYQGDEMMQYTTQQGAQGICPPGWHLPTHEEWKVLEGVVDSLYGIGDPEWDQLEFRGYDAGTNLKTTSGWNYNGNGTDLFGFSGPPSGYRFSNGVFYNGVFYDVGYIGFWWSSTEFDYGYAWYRSLGYYFPEVYRYYWDGISVRCVRDD